MEKEIGQCIASLFNALNAKSEEETMRMFGDAIKHAKESKTKIGNLENFNCFVNHKLKKGIKLLADTLHERSVCKDKDKPNFIYLNYDFLEHNVQELCELREGSCCCADKSRSILGMYFQYSLSGEVPAFNPEDEHYWTPNFGTYQEWINLCEGLYHLYYGKPEQYLKSYNALIQSEIRKYKHILHTWYLKFTDGQIIEFYTTWDDNQENPLNNEHFDKGDYYVIYKKYVKDRHYEIHKDENFLRNHYCKVPKTDIAEIYKISEEKVV